MFYNLYIKKLNSLYKERFFRSLKYDDKEKLSEIIKKLGNLGNTKAVDVLLLFLEDTSIDYSTMCITIDALKKLKWKPQSGLQKSISIICDRSTNIIDIQQIDKELIEPLIKISKSYTYSALDEFAYILIGKIE